eukprot:scaffold9103_cov267-Chaetoceros_neogracile.AAC.4
MQSYIPSSHRSPPLSPLLTAQCSIPITTTTALNLYYEFVIHQLNPLCSFAEYINPIPLIMNFISRTSSLGSRAISCLSNKILHTNTTTSPSVFFSLQTSNMGTKAMLKTNKAAAKRIRVRGSGSVKRSKGGFAHNTGYKTRKRSNNTGRSTGIQEPAIEKRLRRLVGK